MNIREAAERLNEDSALRADCNHPIDGSRSMWINYHGALDKELEFDGYLELGHLLSDEWEIRNK